MVLEGNYFVIIAMDAGSTNLLGIADSGTVNGSGAILLNTNDTVILYAIDTSYWLELPSDN